MADPAYIVDGVLADGEAWVGLNTATLESDTATITFKSGFADGDDPAGSGSGGVQNWDQYMDLVIIGYSRTDTGHVYGWIGVNLNDDTDSNYDQQWLYGNGSSATGYGFGDTVWYMGSMGGGAGANEFGVGVFQIFDINSGKHKTGLGLRAADSDGDGFVSIQSGTWKSQEAVSEIDLTEYTTNGNIVAGSSFSLFGVLPRMVA
jgi:hypothetical protein